MGFFPQGGLGIRANETEYSGKKLSAQSPSSAQISDRLGLLQPTDFFLKIMIHIQNTASATLHMQFT